MKNIHINIKNLFTAISIFVVSLCISCQQKSPTFESGNPSLSFVADTMPAGALLAEGGSITFEVDWAYTKWTIKSDSVVEGTRFILNTVPYSAGADNTSGKTTVTLHYSKNDTYNTKKQVLVLSGGDGGVIRKYFGITQSPKTI